MVNHTVRGELLSEASTYTIQPISVHSQLKRVAAHHMYKLILVLSKSFTYQLMHNRVALKDY
jgi:hypothetical protein